MYVCMYVMQVKEKDRAWDAIKAALFGNINAFIDSLKEFKDKVGHHLPTYLRALFAPPLTSVHRIYVCRWQRALSQRTISRR